MRSFRIRDQGNSTSLKLIFTYLFILNGHFIFKSVDRLLVSSKNLTVPTFPQAVGLKCLLKEGINVRLSIKKDLLTYKHARDKSTFVFHYRYSMCKISMAVVV